MQDVHESPIVLATDLDRRRELSALDPTGNGVGTDTEILFHLFAIDASARVVSGWQHSYLSKKWPTQDGSNPFGLGLI